MPIVIGGGSGGDGGTPTVGAGGRIVPYRMRLPLRRSDDERVELKVQRRGPHVDVTGWTAKLALKDSQHVRDDAPRVARYTGVVFGSVQVGFTASFEVPSDDLALDGLYWFHGWLLTPGSEPKKRSFAFGPAPVLNV